MYGRAGVDGNKLDEISLLHPVTSGRTKVRLAIALVAIVAGLWWWSQEERTPRGNDPNARAQEPTAGGPLRNLADHEHDPTGTFPWESASASITGTVYAEEGGPLAGAQVCAQFDHPELPSRLSLLRRCTVADTEAGIGCPTSSRSKPRSALRHPDGLRPYSSMRPGEAVFIQHRVGSWRASI